nr:hypothetical protein Ycf37 [Echinothamnion sp.]
MSNSILFFRLYLLILLSFLFLFSVILSKQLFIIIINKLKLISLSSDVQKNKNFNEESYMNLLSIYLFCGNILISVALSEFILVVNNNPIQKDLIYASLAYSYYYYSFYSIAEYYYFKILSFSPSNYQAILNLAQMYFDLGYRTKANDLFIRAKSVKSMYS